MTRALSFNKAQRAVDTVEQRLKRVVEALIRLNVPFAVVGGNAVAVWVSTVDEGAVRSTKDVDLLLRRSDLERATAALADHGFKRAEVGGVTMFLDHADPLPSRGVHVIFAKERVRPTYEHPAPDVTNLHHSTEGVPTIGIADLVVMKLQAFRRVDQVHLADLVRVGLVSDDVAAQVPPDLHPRLDEIRSNPDG